MLRGEVGARALTIFVLVELAWDNAGKRTGSSNHEKPHNSSAGQVRSGPVSAPGAAVMSRLQFTTGAGHRRGRARQTRPTRSQRPPCRRQQRPTHPSTLHTRARPYLLSRHSPHAQHTRTPLHPAALASVPYGVVLVRVRVPSAKESARVAPPRIAARAACRVLATPRKEVRPKARRTKLAITPRS